MKRMLSLKTEHLTELPAADLAEVVGGQTLTGIYPTTPLNDCLGRVTNQTCTW